MVKETITQKMFLSFWVGSFNNINQQLLYSFPINCLKKCLFQKVEEMPKKLSQALFFESLKCAAQGLSLAGLKYMEPSADPDLWVATGVCKYTEDTTVELVVFHC